MSSDANSDYTSESLVAAFEELHLVSPVVRIIRSTSQVDLLTHKAVQLIHGSEGSEEYIKTFMHWARTSSENIANLGTEIPKAYSQGDLYLCEESTRAISGAVGAVCEAIDLVAKSRVDSEGTQRAFVAVRPPGHHCGEDTPSGFCFVNNVAIGAAHAFLSHGISRVAILDIDLHHGNGTQAITWGLNAEAHRHTLEAQAQGTNKSDLRIFYGSIHDILSYPCEDGDLELVQAASTSIQGAHGQYIHNLHLEPYDSNTQFFEEIYPQKYATLLSRAEAFFQATNSSHSGNSSSKNEDTLVIISCGFDASEYEYPSMSRHDRRVPATFYHRFAVDACALAERCAGGRLVSVLEGGYSDRALTGGALAHLVGLTQGIEHDVDESWWNVENLKKLEELNAKAATSNSTRHKRGTVTKPALEPWLERTLELLPSLGEAATYEAPPLPSTRRSARARRRSGVDSIMTPDRPTSENNLKSKTKAPVPESPPKLKQGNDKKGIKAATGSDASEEQPATKKLPRVILHVRPPADTS